MYKYMIWELHGPLRRKILQLMSLRCQISGPYFSLNVYGFWMLRGGSPLASYEEKFEFGDLKMLNLFRSLFQSNFFKYDFGFYMPPWLRKFYI